MAQLEDKDIEVLGYYAHQGMRERYWNYINYVEKRELGQGYSGYGILALGVVRNDNMPGKIANNYAQNYVESHPVNGKTHLSEQGWEQVGKDLLVTDFAERQAHFAQNRPDLALNLPVENVYYSHKVAFEKNGIDAHAWTPAILIDASYARTGNHAESNQIWHEMLNSENLGLSRAVHSLKRQGANDELVSMYTVNQTRAYAEALTDVPYTSLDTIRTTEPTRTGKLENHFYHKEGSMWLEGYVVGGALPYILPVLSSDKVHHLEAISKGRASQIGLSADENRHDLDPNRKIALSRQTIADNRNYGQEQHMTAHQPTPQRDVQSDKEPNPRRERFEQLFAAVMGDDDVTTRHIQKEIMNSEFGQQFVAQAKATVAEQDRQAQEQQAQLAQQAEIDAPARRGPVMRM